MLSREQTLDQLVMPAVGTGRGAVVHAPRVYRLCLDVGGCSEPARKWQSWRVRAGRRSRKSEQDRWERRGTHGAPQGTAIVLPQGSDAQGYKRGVSKVFDFKERSGEEAGAASAAPAQPPELGVPEASPFP